MADKYGPLKYTKVPSVHVTVLDGVITVVAQARPSLLGRDDSHVPLSCCCVVTKVVSCVTIMSANCTFFVFVIGAHA